MTKLRHFIDWAETHPKVWLDCVRIYLGLGLFILIHLVPTAPDVRGSLVQRIGEGAYKGIFSLLSILGLALIVYGYGKLHATPAADLGPADRLRQLIVLAPPVMLLYCLLVRGGILDGWAGLFYALQRAVAEAILSLYLLRAHLGIDRE